MNLKKDRLYFIKEVKRIITRHGGEQAGSYRINPNKPDALDSDFYLIKTPGNRLKMTIHNELDHRLVYSVFGMLQFSDSRVGNPHSGKVNFHANDEIKEVVADFEDWICGVLDILTDKANDLTEHQTE